MLIEQQLLKKSRIKRDFCNLELLNESTLLVKMKSVVENISFIIRKTERNDKHTVFNSNKKIDVFLNALHKIYSPLNYSSNIDFIFLTELQFVDESKFYVIPVLIRLAVEGINKLFESLNFRFLDVKLNSIYKNNLIDDPLVGEILVSNNYIITVTKGAILYFKSFGNINEYNEKILYN
ncbi:hypothetical protein NUSPORA_01168 [Nucleospora cyclopteri]